MTKCAIIPAVKNSKNEIVNSRLYMDLLTATNNRKTASSIYNRVRNPDFMKRFGSKVNLDENSEPTMESLYTAVGLEKYINNEDLRDLVGQENDFTDKRGAIKYRPYSLDNYSDVINEINNYNSFGKFNDKFIATLAKFNQEDKSPQIGVVVLSRSRKLEVVNEKMMYDFNLNKKLRAILESKNVSIGALTKLEKGLNINGVADFDLASAATNGTIEMIRLAEGIKGEQALPEEFAHFAIEALGDHPLVTRLMNYLMTGNNTKIALGEDYDLYHISYNGDVTKLAKEAMGKMVAKSLLNNEEIEGSTVKPLFSRLKAAIFSFFKRMSINELEKAKIDANNTASKIAKGVLNGALENDISVYNIQKPGLLYSVSNKISKEKQVLEAIIENKTKAYNIAAKRNPDGKFTKAQQLFLDKLETDLLDNNELKGIYSALEDAVTNLTSVENRFTALSTGDTPLKEKAKTLRAARDFMFGYAGMIKDIKDVLMDESKDDDENYYESIRSLVDDTTILLDTLFLKYEKIARPLFADFLKPIMGDSVNVAFGKNKGAKIDINELLLKSSKDISFFDRWLDSMADSSDYLLRIMDHAVKLSKGAARLTTITMQKELEAAVTLLEQSGTKNTEFMFERDSKGNVTKRYLTEIDYPAFYEAKTKFYEGLKEEFGENPEGKKLLERNRQSREWQMFNTERGNPKLSLYSSAAFKKLTAGELTYYKTVMALKSELDNMLPENYTKLNNSVKIRKDLVERLKTSGNKGHQLIEAIKDNFIKRSDDTEYGDKTTSKDFEGNEVQSLPIYYTKLNEGESTNDISMDVTTTLTAYAAMANDYYEMGKIINSLEVGRALIKDREYIENRSGKPLVEKYKVMGRTITKELTRKGSKTFAQDRLDDFFTMQVYGKYMADEGTLMGMDKGKLANFINKSTALNTLAVNILSGISNVATGKVMMRIESFSGEFFNERDTIIADKNYTKAMKGYVGDIGNKIKTSKLSLWSQLFNVAQDYSAEIKDINYDRRDWYKKMFTSNSLFFLSNAGEHWMQHRTSLALANKTLLLDKNGKKISLWDACEVVYIDANNKALGATLEIKDGVTNLDGSEFDQSDIIKFSRKTAAINQKMHGIYNLEDRSAAQRLAIGRLAIMFRKWIKPSLNRRFKSANHNFDLGSTTEGYYNTSGRFIQSVFSDIKGDENIAGFLNKLVFDLSNTKYQISANWKSLHKTEKANIRRALTEVSHLLALALVLGLIDWDDEEDKNWIYATTEYQLRRLYTELGALVPGKTMVSEGLKLIQAPAAGVNIVEGALNLVSLLNPYSYMTEMQSGRYKGHSVAYKSLFNSPLIIGNRTIYRGLNPETGIPFYK